MRGRCRPWPDRFAPMRCRLRMPEPATGPRASASAAQERAQPPWRAMSSVRSGRRRQRGSSSGSSCPSCSSGIGCKGRARRVRRRARACPIAGHSCGRPAGVGSSRVPGPRAVRPGVETHRPRPPPPAAKPRCERQRARLRVPPDANEAARIPQNSSGDGLPTTRFARRSGAVPASGFETLDAGRSVVSALRVVRLAAHAAVEAGSWRTRGDAAIARPIH